MPPPIRLWQPAPLLLVVAIDVDDPAWSKVSTVQQGKHSDRQRYVGKASVIPQGDADEPTRYQSDSQPDGGQLRIGSVYATVRGRSRVARGAADRFSVKPT